MLSKIIKAKIEELEAEVAELEEIFGEDMEEFNPSDGGNFDDTYYTGQEHGETFGQLAILRKVLKLVEKEEKEHLEVKAKLSEAEGLLGDARSLLDNIHGYDTETYRNIGVFLYGEEEEEDEEDDDVLIECVECGEERFVERGTFAHDKDMCYKCYNEYQGG
jgi:hypothetical protein